jgi:tetratricopeptide (TPR) repeat protein
MKAMKVAEEIGDLRMVSANLGNLGVTQFTLGQFAQTIETFERAMSMWERMSDQNSECWGLSSIGASHFEMGEYGKAQDFIMRSIELSEKIDDQWKLCGALIYMSELARMAGRLAEAAEHYARTLSIAEKLESVDFAVDAEAGLAETSIATGDLPGAEKLAAHAVLKAKEGGLRVELANALRVHGLALSGLGEAREAERRFVEALEIHAGIENRVGKAKLLYALGWTRMARGEGHGGRSEVESARATFSECGMRRWAEMCDSVLSSSA